MIEGRLRRFRITLTGPSQLGEELGHVPAYGRRVVVSMPGGLGERGPSSLSDLNWRTKPKSRPRRDLHNI
jgi:hypothetical protein